MIWCVEDDSSIRDIEVYALTSTGFDAKGFEDGDSFWNVPKYFISQSITKLAQIKRPRSRHHSLLYGLFVCSYRLRTSLKKYGFQ